MPMQILSELEKKIKAIKYKFKFELEVEGGKNEQ